MRTISKAGKTEKKGKTKNEVKEEPTHHAKVGFFNIAKSIFPLMLVAAVSASITGFVTVKILSKTDAVKDAVLGSTDNNQAEVVPVASPDSTESDLGIGGLDIVKIIIPEGIKAEVKKEPGKGSVTILSFTTSLNAVRLEEKENWVRVLIGNTITVESTTEGWIEKSFVKEIDNVQTNTNGINNIQKVTISETPTGWLRVRVSPNGKEIAKVNAGETFTLVSESNGWYEVELSDGTKGFVSKEYSTLE